MRANIVFIVSSERSGSNLLRRMLANHTSITGPKAPHLLKTFWPVPVPADAFTDPAARKVIFELMQSVVNCRLHDWKFAAQFEAFNATFRPANLLEFFNAFYHAAQRADQAEWIVCKENNLWEFFDELHSFYGDGARWIYLHRDPRDVVASWMNVPLGPSTARQAARQWNREQDHCLEIAANGFMQVAYEQLIERPEAEIARIVHFIGLPQQESCAHPEWTPSRDGTTDNLYWKNLNEPVLRNNSGKYETLFDASGLFQIQREVASAAGRLGYRVGSRNPFVTGYGWVSHVVRRYFARSPQKKVVKNDGYTEELLLERARIGHHVQRELERLVASRDTAPASLPVGDELE